MNGEHEAIFSASNERAYRVYFNHIRHENKLMIDRMKSMLQFHSLLLIAYATTWNATVSLSPHSGLGRFLGGITFVLALFQTLICLAGCYASASAVSSIGAAWLAMGEYCRQFEAKCREMPSLACWPALRGAGIPNLSHLGGLLARATPWAFLTVWLVVLALTWVAYSAKL
jgi:hypothetical protein